jgi:hypothetical protein
MRIRIAQKGWRGAEQARTLEEVQVGVTLPWVELDGVRFTDIAGVEFSASKDGFGEARLTLAAGRIDAQTPFLNRPDREQP